MERLVSAVEIDEPVLVVVIMETKEPTWGWLVSVVEFK